jgi:hypothetical protein
MAPLGSNWPQSTVLWMHAPIRSFPQVDRYCTVIGFIVPDTDHRRRAKRVRSTATGNGGAHVRCGLSETEQGNKIEF